MARFLFIWMVMLGAMIGVREGTHFEVDVWPELEPRANALLRIVSTLFVLVFALVFVWWGIKFVQFGWNQTSELAELPMTFIFVAWPLAGVTWLLFLRRGASCDDLPQSLRRTRHGRMTRRRADARRWRRWSLFGAFFVLMSLRVPVAFALGLACLPVLLFEPRLSPMVLFNETFKAYNSFILLAVPFFLLTANLMNVGGITDRLVRLSRTMVGNFPGALAQINVLLSVFFAGISGSSTADAASQGKIFIEAQVKEGYDLSFSIAITAVSAVLAVIIPPSILMIVWGGVLSVSIGALYLAGIIPGLLIAARADGDRARLRQDPQLPGLPARDAAGVLLLPRRCRCPALMTPFIIVGGILLGWFTRDRVGGGRRDLCGGAVDLLLPRDGPEAALARAARDRQALRASRCSASAPRRCSAGCSPTTRSRRRCWRTSRPGAWASSASASSSPSCSWSSAASSTRSRRSSSSAPCCSRWRASVDMHPVQFAIIGIVSLAFGLVTPPYGLCLMISCAVAKVRLRYALKDTMIMLVPMLLVLAAIIIWPEIPLILPRLISPEFLQLIARGLADDADRSASCRTCFGSAMRAASTSRASSPTPTFAELERAFAEAACWRPRPAPRRRRSSWRSRAASVRPSRTSSTSSIIPATRTS